MKRLFQVRSRQRDAETDKKRVGSIVRSIDAAIASATKERDALQFRVSDARDLASLASGTAHDEQLTRDPADEKILKEYELQMQNGEKRICELNQQIVALIELRDLSNRSFFHLLEVA